MRKATQGNDLNTALKVKDALQNLEIEIPASPGPADQNALKHALLAGTWSLWNNLESSGPADFQIEFHKDGKC